MNREPPGTPPRLAYVAAQLPARSETFVYQEIFGLRGRGWPVVPVSLREPRRDLGEPRLERLAAEALVVYAPGFWRAGLREALRHPGVLGRAVLDALFRRDVPWRKRPAVVAQGLGGLALARRLRSLGVDRLHAHMAHAPTGVAMYAARALGVPFSFTGHAADLFRDRQNLVAKLERASAVACISRWHRDFYARLAPRSRAERVLIRCGVDVRGLSAGPRPGTRTILAVGRLVEKKGLDVLLEAAARLRGPFRVRIAGEGPERGRLESIAGRRGLTDRVAFLGEVGHACVPSLMREADVFALPCRPARSGDRDGIPVVLMEAMACGVPVVSGDLPTIRELVEPGGTGLLVPPGDVEALAAALQQLLDDPEHGARLAEAGRRRVEREFSRDAALDALERIFGPRPARPQR